MNHFKDARDCFFNAVALFGVPALIVWQIYWRISTYGKTWAFGRFGMPRAFLSPSGETFADGSQVIPWERMLINAGIQEELEIITIVLFGLVSCFIVHELRRVQKKIVAEQLDHTVQICKISRRMTPGEGLLADEAISRYWRKDRTRLPG